MEAGGLHIIGSERHESRRIDRQLRGRAGRQGDPGRVAVLPVARRRPDAPVRLRAHRELMDRLGAQEGEVLTHPLITRSIEQAQKRVELQNFQARKRLLEYDDVMNQQREVIYSLRLFALEGGEELKGEALKMIEKALDAPRRDDARRVRGSRRSGISICCGRTCSCTTCCRCLNTRSLIDRPTDEAMALTVAVAAAQRRRSGDKLEEPGYRARRSRDALRRPAALARDAQRARREVEGPPLRSRPAAQRDPLPVLGPEGPARRVQAGSVQDVRGPDERHLQHVHRALSQGAAHPRAAGAAATAAGGSAQEALQRARHPRGRPGDEGAPPSSNGDTAVDVGPGEPPRQKPDGPQGSARSWAPAGPGRSRARRSPANTDWSSVGRNDPCPCGSGKKFKKCHGATL